MLYTMQITNATVKVILKSVITIIKISVPSNAVTLGTKYSSALLSDNLPNNSKTNIIVMYTKLTLQSSSVQAVYNTASTEYISPTINISILLLV